MSDVRVSIQPESDVRVSIQPPGQGTGQGIGGVTTDDTLHGTGTADNPLGVNVLTKSKLINLLDAAGFPTTFLQQGE